MVSPLPTLVTLEEAVAHLKLPSILTLSADDPDRDDLELKIEAATDLVLTYIWRDDDDWVDTMIAWTGTTVPRQIKAAILVQLGELYRFRGDDIADTAGPTRQHGFLSPQVTAYLHRYRDPGIA